MIKLLSASSIVSILLCSLMLVSIGCTGDGFGLAPVSGIITVNGNPVPNLEVVFYPKPTKENPTPGPFATGKTDGDGKFSLTARGGEPGATVGINRIGFELPGDGQDALEDLADQLEEAKAEGDTEGAKKAKTKLNKLRRKLKDFADIPEHLLARPTLEIVVPAEGLTDHLIELAESNQEIN